jgi:hypothetical protein
MTMTALLVLAFLASPIAASLSAAEGTAASVLVDNNTTGYYNNALGTVLDGTQLQFPPADSYGGKDPTIPNAPEPNLAPAASILGSWLSSNPLPLNANWSGLQAIPKSWAANIENAIIYPVSVGPQGFTRVVGNFGVDNGLFVWVNGRYKFGAMAPGAVGGFEYTNVDLGSLPPGLNYIQILREDHGYFGGFTVLITGTVEAASGHITSPVENSTTGPVTLIFSAEAWSNIGVGVKQVEFYVYYDRLWHAAGIDTSAPYEVIWQTPNKLRSQQLRFGIHMVDNANNTIQFADVVNGVNYRESLGNPDVAENWVPTRAYLNQRSLEPNGDSKCSAASMAMMLAMNSIIDWDYGTMKNKANEMYPRVLNANGDAYIDGMVAELEGQGMEAETSSYSANSAWSIIKQQIDAGRPVIVRTKHGAVTAFGHFFVAVGYREAVGSRQVIAYDPFGRWLGTCCTNNYDFNTRDAGSRKGQWVSYDFDLAFGSSNWLITASPATSRVGLIGTTATPTTRPDVVSNEPESIGTYSGVNIQAIEKVFLPFIARR